jgi:hypothetical protein
MENQMKSLLRILPILVFAISAPALADQQLISTRVEQPPAIDGNDTDSGWSAATAIVTDDLITNKKITIKSIHDYDRIYFLVQYPDDTDRGDARVFCRGSFYQNLIKSHTIFQK